MGSTRAGRGTPAPAACACLCALLWFQSTAKERAAFPEVDPYTRGEPAALEKAGYASLGPFLWGDGHTTEQVEEAFGGLPVIWVETEHFKLGSSLPEYRIAKDPDERAKLRAELARLSERLPRVNKRTAELDPWLRLHLFAARLEELYGRFCAKLELDETDFAAPSAGTGRPTGPYLGMKGKFSVLLVQEGSALDRYSRTFVGRAEQNALTHHFEGVDALLLGLSAAGFRELEAFDTALHFALVYDVVLNFELGFRGFTHAGPPWWQHGLARWFAREVDPRLLLFATPGGTSLRTAEDSDWGVKVRARVEAGVFPSTSEMLTWGDASKWSFVDHMIAWSRVDYLLARDDGSARRLFVALHEPVPWTPERDQRIAAQLRGALETTTGLSPQEFDEAWCRYVKSSYERD